MFIKSLLILLGTLICAHLPVLPPFSVSFFLPLVLYLSVRYRRLSYVGWMACGFLWFLFNAHLMLDKKLLPEYEGESLIAEGIVASLPEQTQISTRFNFKVMQLSRDGKKLDIHPERVRLSWYQGRRSIRPGEKWRLKVRLKRPHGFMNPGGFDYEAWLFQSRLNATGYVLGGRENMKLSEAGQFSIHALRLTVKNKIEDVIPEDHLSAFIPALIIGERTGLSKEHWQVLTGTGTNHLMAISGLHIGLIASITYFVFLRLGNMNIWPPVYVPRQKIASCFAMLFAGGYALLAGFSIPTQRALVMLWLYFTMRLCHRAVSPMDVLGMALMIILIIDPFSAMSASFWLSFSAVIIIFYGMSYRLYRKQIGLQLVKVQYIISIGLIPVLAFYYQQIPIWTILANLLAVPLVSFIVIPLLMCGVGLLFIEPDGAEAILALALHVLSGLWFILEYIHAREFNLISIAQPGWFALVLAVCGALFLLLPKGITARWLGALWLLPLFLPHVQRPQHGDVDITTLDVGQGLAVVVQTKNHNLLYDAGPLYSERFDAGAAVITPFLKSAGVRSLDRLMLSHGDSDHIGGLSSVIGEIPVSSILSSVPEAIDHPHTRSCHRGQSWRWDGVDFSVLHPGKDSTLRGNNRSCVLKISAGKVSMLLTGDIEAAAEGRLLSGHKRELKSTALLAPHHGSKTSSTPAFIEAISPELVIFSAGYRNRFKLPDQAILSRYQDDGAQTLITARTGAIKVSLHDGEMTISTQRKIRRRFWHTMPHS